MSKEKIYLEPRNEFDQCIIQETAYSITYGVEQILDMLSYEYSTDNPELSVDDLFLMALEYFEYNIEPLKHYYALEFVEVT